MANKQLYGLLLKLRFTMVYSISFQSLALWLSNSLLRAAFLSVQIPQPARQPKRCDLFFFIGLVLVSRGDLASNLLVKRQVELYDVVRAESGCDQLAEVA